MKIATTKLARKLQIEHEDLLFVFKHHREDLECMGELRRMEAETEIYWLNSKQALMMILLAKKLSGPASQHAANLHRILVEVTKANRNAEGKES